MIGMITMIISSIAATLIPLVCGMMIDAMNQ